MSKLPAEVKGFFRKKGSKGGKTTAKRLGSQHFSNIAKKRWDKQKKLSTTKA